MNEQEFKIPYMRTEIAPILWKLDEEQFKIITSKLDEILEQLTYITNNTDTLIVRGNND